ncbi:stress protein [Thiorhodococcus drewsii AZ1]|uniref:Stress protein n=1 Tax=Thiorhodococcus drewsii AZ1 TaxID=765913 RepID=G2E5U8_9GAMM|nr:TerD family protein [Thiorhodococcus drewsii]EGV28593.1 stress protein [Thiorhodococcus drewsii AZ1]
MTDVLVRGANVQIDREQVLVGVGWDADAPCEIDASAFLLSASDRVRCDADFVFYNQPVAESECLMLNAEPNNGEDRRAFAVDLTVVPDDVAKIVISITLDLGRGGERPSFGMLNQVYIRLVDPVGDCFARYDLQESNDELALILGELYRYHGIWKFRAVGHGYNGGLEALAVAFGVNVDSSGDGEDHAEENDQDEVQVQTPTLKRRKTRQQALMERAAELQKALRSLMPLIQAATESQCNESNTRMVIDRMLMEAFGYSMDEVKAEQRIQGRKADYVLSVDSEDLMVGEAKRAGMSLRDKHIFQATSYGAYSGIRWAFLTNLTTWQVYHISAHDKVEANLVFSVDLQPDISLDDCARLALISRYGLARKRLLEQHWNEVNALARENVIRAILTEDVINRLRIVIKRDSGCNFDNEQVQQVVEELLAGL